MWIGGDSNMSHASWAQLAREVDAVPRDGHGVDRGMVRGCTVVKVLNLGRHGSDTHDALLWVLRLPSGDVVRILAWNVWRGQDPLDVQVEVATMIDHQQPHVVFLFEAYRCRDALGTIPGYRRFQGRGIGEAAACAALVRRDVTVLRGGWLRMSHPWHGPKHGRRHDGRVWPRLRLRFKRGGVLRALGVHLATERPAGNAPAVDEQRDALVRWAGKAA